MDAERWRRVQSLFHNIVDRPDTERESALHAACGGDETLCGDVRALLSADAHPATLLSGGVAQMAGRVLDSGGENVGVPEKFGPYRILRLIGEGGMGTVYLAERDDLGTLVAIKFLRDAW